MGNDNEIIPLTHQDNVNTVIFSPNGKYVATASADHTARVWDRSSGREIVRITHNDNVISMAFSPNGKYLAWLCAGPLIPAEFMRAASSEYLLTLNGETLFDEKPSFADYDSEKYIYRFLWTQYSERPHALWLDYIDRMYPVREEAVEVTDGTLSLTAKNFFVSALILVPASQQKDFERMAAKIRKTRVGMFETTLRVPPQTKPGASPDDGDYIVYVPDDEVNLRPDTAPSAAERARTSLNISGAPGQNVFGRIAVVPFAELGACELALSDLSGPAGTIPAAAFRGYFLNYNYAPLGPQANVLLPSLSLNVEKGVTQCFWLRLIVPDDAEPGKYSGAFTFRTSAGKETDVPVEFEVYPFRLQPDLSFAYYMYYSGRWRPTPPDDARPNVLREQFKWKRGLGFTSVTGLVGARGASVNENAGTTRISFDDTNLRLAIEAGFISSPEQVVIAEHLGIARNISRRLQPAGPGDPACPVDLNPGVEFTHPKFKSCWMSAFTQFKAFLDKLGYRHVMYTVDEPREVPNPWNRNLADTCRYGDWLGEVGFTGRFVSPMGDTQSGLDYTELVNHFDIINTHPAAGSRRLMAKTHQDGRELWFYNGGYSRMMWGVYQFKHNSRSYSQWHWSWADVNALGGYPGADWYNPFTGMYATANNAPIAKYPGAFLPGPRLFTAAEGMTDAAYIATLLKSIARHKAAGTRPEAVANAEALLRTIREKTPEFPAHGRGGHDALPLSEWRAAMAKALMDLQ